MTRIKDLDVEDLRIEKGELDPPEENMFYPKGVLSILNMVFRNKKYDRPRGKQSPKFSKEDIWALADLLLFKSPYVVLKIYQRLPKERELPLKRRVFINHFLGDAKFNAAKAARMAGYSSRSAKQIAYKIKQS